MNVKAAGTLLRHEKGPVGPAPTLEGPLQTIVEAVSSWPGIQTTVHWHLFDRTRIDGVDFYWQETELGHLHLDGSIHLATDPSLGKAMVAEGVAKPFRYQHGWVEQEVRTVGPDAAIALFRRNLEELQRVP